MGPVLCWLGCMRAHTAQVAIWAPADAEDPSHPGQEDGQMLKTLNAEERLTDLQSRHGNLLPSAQIRKRQEEKLQAASSRQNSLKLENLYLAEISLCRDQANDSCVFTWDT